MPRKWTDERTVDSKEEEEERDDLEHSIVDEDFALQTVFLVRRGCNRREKTQKDEEEEE